MNRKMITAACVALGLAASSAMAVLEGFNNITIWDEAYGPGPNGNTQLEDQETDYEATFGQQWDMEAFMYDGGSQIAMVGGFNMDDGFGGFRSGDIFIDLDGDATIPASYPTLDATYGYEYVLDVNWATTQTYKVIDLTSGGPVVLSVSAFASQHGADPVRYVSGGTTLAGTGNLYYSEGYSDAQTGFTGGSHNVALFDLSEVGGLWSSISSGGSIKSGVTFHFTQECGNDILVGHVAVPDGGLTVGLMGMALVGLGLVSRKIR